MMVEHFEGQYKTSNPNKLIDFTVVFLVNSFYNGAIKSSANIFA